MLQRLLYKWLLFIPVIICAEEDFISHFEYGQMLYNNPRGVSCAQCHGMHGEGKVIVMYGNKKHRKALKGSDIRYISYEEMKKSLNSTHPVMPRYYLTDKEIRTIFDYLQKSNEKIKLEK